MLEEWMMDNRWRMIGCWVLDYGDWTMDDWVMEDWMAGDWVIA